MWALGNGQFLVMRVHNDGVRGFEVLKEEHLEQYLKTLKASCWTRFDNLKICNDTSAPVEYYSCQQKWEFRTGLLLSAFDI